METLKEGKRLWTLGWAVHWLRPKSKAPIEKRWASGERKTWGELLQTRPRDANMGVRLGTASRLKSGLYLGVIDCDVKSSKAKDLAEMREKFSELWLPEDAPTVESGRGNGSCHVYVASKEPLKPRRVAQSSHKVKVKMPSAKPSPFELANLTKDEIENGFRFRPAWEISIMGEGQQVVLPPSIHPDTVKVYKWRNPCISAKQLPVFKDPWAGVDKSVETVDNSGGELEPFSFKSTRLPQDIVRLVVSGEGTSGNRSDDLFRAARVMRNCGLSDNQVLWALTEESHWISEAARDRRGPSLKAQVEWVRKYTLNKIKRESSPQSAFKDAVSDEFENPSKSDTGNNWKEKLTRNKDKRLSSTLQNVDLILSHAVNSKLFRRDVFALRDFYEQNTPWGGLKDGALTDEDAPKIKLWLGQQYNFEPGKDVIFDAMTIIACRNAFDPVRDFLEALPEWDGTERLNTWLKDNFEAEGDPEYLDQVFRKWMVALVKRVYEPGAKFDWMPIFEGAQGVGKSSFGRLLVGDKWFSDGLPDLKDKDAALNLQGIWLVEMGELANLRRNEIETVKAFITRTVDKVRPPYGKRWLESTRRSVFFGTTNREEYLVDDTGNRRFKPIRVGQLNFKALRAQRVQLFAEALFIYKMGFETEISLNMIEGDSAKTFEAQIQSKKMVTDDSESMVHYLVHWFEEKAEKNRDKKTPKNEIFNFEKFAILDLFKQCLGDGAPLQKWPPTNRNFQFAAKALRKLGGEKTRNKSARYWKITNRWPQND